MVQKGECPECGRMFKRKRDNQTYCRKRCKNRAAARRLRERAKAYDQHILGLTGEARV